MTVPKDDIENTLNNVINLHDIDKRYAPAGEPPLIKAPRHLEFRQLGNNAYTDRAIADQFLRNYRHLFINGDGNLYYFIEARRLWTLDAIPDQIRALCHHLSDDEYEELGRVRAQAAAGTDVGERITQLLKNIQRCESFKTMSSTAAYLQSSLKAIATENEKQEMNPVAYDLACAGNQMVDLRTGDVRHRKAEDYATRTTGILYKHDLDTSAWEKVVLDICQGNKRLLEFLQVWFGYCLTGARKEQCMVILWGDGSNGKNLLIDAVARAMGEYAYAMPQGSMEGKPGGGGMDNNELYASARLAGIRLGYISETGEKNKMRESWVKAQTGDATITARSPHQDFFEFTATHKFTIGTNHKPVITGTDDGVWRRIRLVQMAAKFGDEDKVAAGIATQLADKALEEFIKTKMSRETVLTWCVRGAMKYAKSGLDRYTPPEVGAATMLYRREQDTLGQFLSTVCEWINPKEVARITELETERGGQGLVRLSNEERLRVGKADLFMVYQQWAIENGHGKLSQQSFSNRITQTHRTWVDDQGGESVMKELSTGRVGKFHFYRYVRLDDQGQRYLYAAKAARPRAENVDDRDD